MVSTVSELTAALTNSAVDRIVLAVAGSPYELTSNMAGCDNSGLCIDRALTVEAEVAGQVVLDGMGERRVLKVLNSGTAELIGLNITRGQTSEVSARLAPLPAT